MVISNLRKWTLVATWQLCSLTKSCLTNSKSEMCRQLDMMKPWQARQTKRPAKGEMKTKREHPRRSHKSKTQAGSPRGKVHYVSEPHCLGHQGEKRTNYVPEPPCLRHKRAKQQIMFQSTHVKTLLVTWQFSILSCGLDKVNTTPCQCGLGEHLLGTFEGLRL